jgi:putative ABC transport system permease protein
MASLAYSNLLYDKVRLVVTLTGVIFAVVLVAVQLGLFIGFMRATSNVIDQSGADVWITAPNVDYLEVGAPISERNLYKVLATSGVANAGKYIVQFVNWKRPDGAIERVELVGFDLDSGLGGPWDLDVGSVRDLQQSDSVIVDRLYCSKLGVDAPGQNVEIHNRRARVVGFTRGIRTFTTSPIVFTSLKHARDYVILGADDTVYILAKAAPGVSPGELKRRIQSRIENVDVHTTEEFSWITRTYWMFGTGAGITILLAAALGFIVGLVIVAQTIYSATVDHLREYGTLKAMGASNGYLYRVIVKQAVINAIAGYLLGIGISAVASHFSRDGKAQVALTGPLAAALFGLTLLMCVSAAVISVNKVTRLDPAIVFKA